MAQDREWLVMRACGRGQGQGQGHTPFRGSFSVHPLQLYLILIIPIGYVSINSSSQVFVEALLEKEIFWIADTCTLMPFQTQVASHACKYEGVSS